MFLVIVVSIVCCGSVCAETATATASTIEDFYFNVDLYDFVSGADYDTDYENTVSSITFSTSTVNFGKSAIKWTSGKTFAKVSSNLKTQTIGTTVYMYTTNSTSTGKYKAVYPKVTWWGWDGGGANVDLYRGLVRQNQISQEKYEEGDYAPIKVLCVSTATANASYKNSYPAQANFVSGRYLVDYADAWTGGERIYNDSVLYDKRNEVNIGISGSSGGIWIGNDTYTESNVIIFFGAEFNNVYSGDKYGTETIRFSIVFDPDGQPGD